MKYFGLMFALILFLVILVIFVSRKPKRHRKTEKYEKFNQLPEVEEKEHTKIPKIIWTYWDSEYIPEVVQKCIGTWRKTNPDYTIVVLTPKNINQFFNADPIYDFPHCKNSVQRTTDFIRLYLIHYFGGFWVELSRYGSKIF